MTFTLSIVQDEDPVNPRLDFNSLGKMICFHKRYNLGDVHRIDPSDFNDWDDLAHISPKRMRLPSSCPCFSTTIRVSRYKPSLSAVLGIQVKLAAFTWLGQPSLTPPLDIRRF